VLIRVLALALCGRRLLRRGRWLAALDPPTLITVLLSGGRRWRSVGHCGIVCRAHDALGDRVAVRADEEEGARALGARDHSAHDMPVGLGLFGNRISHADRHLVVDLDHGSAALEGARAEILVVLDGQQDALGAYGAHLPADKVRLVGRDAAALGALEAIGAVEGSSRSGGRHVRVGVWRERREMEKRS